MDKQTHQVLFTQEDILALQVAVVDQMSFFANAIPQLMINESNDQTIEKARILLSHYKDILNKLDLTNQDLVGQWQVQQLDAFTQDRILDPVKYEVTEEVTDDIDEIAEVIEIKEKRKSKEGKKEK